MQRATDLFVQRFARPEDYIDVSRVSGWLPRVGGRYGPDVECFATFCRAEGDSDIGAVELDPSGWADNIGNVRELTVVLTRKVIESEHK